MSEATRTEKILIACSHEEAAEVLVREAALAIEERRHGGFYPGLALSARAVARWHKVYEILPEVRDLDYAQEHNLPRAEQEHAEKELIIAVANHINGTTRKPSSPSKSSHLSLVKKGER